MKPLATIDPKRLGSLAAEFSGAFLGTPEDEDFVARTRKALAMLPDEVVRELGEAVDVLATLTNERLATPEVKYEAIPEANRVAEQTPTPPQKAASTTT